MGGKRRRPLPVQVLVPVAPLDSDCSLGLRLEERKLRVEFVRVLVDVCEGDQDLGPGGAGIWSGGARGPEVEGER